MAQSVMLNEVGEANYRHTFNDEKGVVSRGFPIEYVREDNQFEGERTPDIHVRRQTTGSQYPSSGVPHGHRRNLSADMHLFVHPQDSMYMQHQHGTRRSLDAGLEGIHGINLGPNIVNGHVEGIQRIDLGPNVVADGHITPQFDFAGGNHFTPRYGQHAPAFSGQGSRPQRTSLEVNTYISHQQTSFLHLTNALEQMTSAQETLKEEVRRMEDEINKQSFQNNPTEKDYRLICQENEYMQTKLSDIFKEIDALEQERAMSQRQAPAPPDEEYYPPYSPSGRYPPAINPPIRPHPNNKHSTTPPRINNIVGNKPLPSPPPPITQEPSPYEQNTKPRSNSRDRLPPYEQNTKPRSNSRDRLPSYENFPPPIPPHIPLLRPRPIVEQNWQCSKCTFSNHCALNTCEMCNTKRV